MSADLAALASRYGIATSYIGPRDEPVAVPETTLTKVLEALGVEADETRRAESLRTAGGFAMPEMTARPGTRCYLPAWLAQAIPEAGSPPGIAQQGIKGAWGIALQLYELRSRRNWGIGDFADLAEFCRVAGDAGADFVGLNPLHALVLAEPERCSPFSPSNRRFLNPLYIAVDAVPGFAASDADSAAIETARTARLVDYAAVARLKLSALAAIWKRWPDLSETLSPPFDRDSFEHFEKEGGEALALHARFEAAAFSGGARDASRPAAPHDPAADDPLFHAWLQWLADIQLGRARQAAREAGMRIGLYLDFAVGEMPNGSAVSGDHAFYVPGMSVGAPPDYFTSGGQDWGLAPVSPRALSSGKLGEWRELMRRAMRHAGALRIDHAMSLWQLFFVPYEASPAEGCYVRYPIADLLDVLAELSREHGTVIIGEDLGHVPEGFRDLMETVAILSYRILYFEMDEQGFVPPEVYPPVALACLSTHDLPTFTGWWRGSDIELRHQHSLIDVEAAADQRAERAPQRAALLAALTRARALPADAVGTIEAAIEDPAGDLPRELFVAVHRYMAKSAACLVAVRVADLVGEAEPTNLPGTIDSYPNWRLKLPVPLEELADHALFSAVTAAMRDERPRPS